MKMCKVELCLVLQAQVNLSNTIIRLSEIIFNFTKKFPGSNFLLSIFSTGGKWDFHVINLLPATVLFPTLLFTRRKFCKEILMMSAIMTYLCTVETVHCWNFFASLGHNATRMLDIQNLIKIHTRNCFNSLGASDENGIICQQFRS